MSDYQVLGIKRRGYSLYGSREIWWIDVEIEHLPTATSWFLQVWPRFFCAQSWLCLWSLDG
jgi:hypothetical protein